MMLFNSCGFCVPRPQLLKRWLQAGVKMKQITSALKLIYPPSAHDYEYYKASTVAYFMIEEVKEALRKVLSVVE
jgi:kinesin family protein 4/21/27